MVNILIVNMYLLCMILGCFFFSTFYLSSVACFFHFTSISYGWDLEWVAHIEKYKYSKWKLCCHPKPWKGGGERSPIVNMYLLCIILRCCFFSTLYLSTIACGFLFHFYILWVGLRTSDTHWKIQIFEVKIALSPKTMEEGGLMFTWWTFS